MATYTVKSGDTLSKIASQYNVPLSQITGYKSGNPNLIYPGEVLNIGGGTTSSNVGPLAPSTSFNINNVPVLDFGITPTVESSGSTAPIIPKAPVNPYIPAGDSGNKDTIPINPSESGTVAVGNPPATPIDTGNLNVGISTSLSALEDQIKNLQKDIDTFTSQSGSTTGGDTGGGDTGGDTGSGGSAFQSDKPFWQTLFDERAKAEAGRPTFEDYDKYLEFSGLKKIRDELIGYQKQMADLELQKQTALANREQAMQGRATSAWIGESALIERGFNSRIAATAANAAWVQLEYDFTKDSADAWMKFKLFDYEQDINDLEWIRNVYKDMTAEEEAEYNKIYKEKQDALEQARWEASYELDKYKAMNSGTASYDVTQGSSSADNDWATNLIYLNPTSSYEELFSSIQANTELSDSEIKMLLAANNVTVASKLTRESISALFGIPDNDKKSGKWGPSRLWQKTNKENLDEIMNLILSKNYISAVQSYPTKIIQYFHHHQCKI